jgi:hypothetical protein
MSSTVLVPVGQFVTVSVNGTAVDDDPELPVLLPEYS